MRYISTRGGAEASGARAILTGLAPDGGLFVPERFPAFDWKTLQGLRYDARAAAVMATYLGDYGEEILADFTRKAYARFDENGAAPLKRIADGLYALELWHGPTLAFKDMALTVLPYLLTEAQRKTGSEDEIVILVATSGDTGKAALEGFKDVPGTRCAVYYPERGVSNMQKRQMATQEGENVHVIAVEGNFDDAQTGVKALFADAELAAEMAQKHLAFSSANSINIGRLLPQVAYYFSAYADMVESGGIRPGDEIVFCVPTGNFGNILAGIYARNMGLPIKRFVCASNKNRVLADFLHTGVYDINRPFYQTDSPSMDILISSNLERLLFELADRDAEQVNAWMAELKRAGHYDIGAEKRAKLAERVYGAWCDAASGAEIIGDLFDQYGYVSDTHSAVGFRALREYRAATGDDAPAVVVSTASPYKFARDVGNALGIITEGLDDFAVCDAIAARTGLPLPARITALKDAPARHSRVCSVSNMKEALRAELGL